MNNDSLWFNIFSYSRAFHISVSVFLNKKGSTEKEDWWLKHYALIYTAYKTANIWIQQPWMDLKPSEKNRCSFSMMRSLWWLRWFCMWTVLPSLRLVSTQSLHTMHPLTFSSIPHCLPLSVIDNSVLNYILVFGTAVMSNHPSIGYISLLQYYAFCSAHAD